MAGLTSVASKAAARLGLRTQHRSLASDLGYVLINQLLLRGTLNVVNIIAANVLTVRQFSSYNYFTLTTGFMASCVGMGLSVATAKVVAESATRRSDHYPALVAAIIWIVGAAAAFCLVASPIYMPWLDSTEVHVSPALLIGGTFALIWYGLTYSGMQGAAAFRATLPPAWVGSFLLLAGCAWSWAVGNEIPIILGVLLFYIVPGSSYFRWLRRADLLPLRTALRLPAAPALREIAGIALPSLGFLTIFTAVNWWIGRSLLEHQSSTSDFAEFAIGMQLFSLALFIPLSVNQALFPRYVKMAQGSGVSAAAVIKPAVVAAGLVLSLALIATPATPLLALVYGSKYELTHSFVAVIFAAAAFSAPAGVIGGSIIASQGAMAWLKVNLVLLALGLGLPLIWPPASELHAALILCVVNVALLVSGALKVLLRQRQPRPA